MEFQIWFYALGAILMLGVVAWLLSLLKNDVSFVDSLWSLFFVVAAGIYYALAENPGMKAALVLTLVVIWALRLSIHITIRNWGEDEDYRYQAIRANNSPFWIKSLYVVFGLQGLLAWFISLPLLVAVTSSGTPGILDFVAIGVWLLGVTFEGVGDYQLSKFRADPANERKVLKSGLWRYTRHPNYFGDFCVWWAFYLFAVSSGGWWTIVSPVLMTALLLKVSGVAMLERTISDRRPEYADYIERTNAFFPGRPGPALRGGRRPGQRSLE